MARRLGTVEGRAAVNASALKWQAANKASCAAKQKRYHAGKMNRTPSWANHDIIALYYIYAEALGLVVDHVVPLQGALVSGLHVENNLQLLTFSENSSKGSRFVPT